MNPKLLLSAVVGLLVGLGSTADAEVLCSDRRGHVRLRESCRRHESVIDAQALANAVPETVPLKNWVVGTEVIEGLESVAAAKDATMLGLDPCRLVDSRPGTTSEFVGDDVGALADHEIRTYTLTGLCGVPAEATALSINLAIVPGVESGFASVGPSGSIAAFPPGPDFASINYEGGALPLSNSLIVPLDDQGRIDVYVARSADVIIDTNGFFHGKETGTNTFFLAGGASAADNGAALEALLADLNATLPVTTRWTIELGPGQFTLANPQTMNRPFTLRGAGQAVTLLTCSCDAPIFQINADGSEISQMEIINSNSGINATGLTIVSADDVVVRHVTLEVTDGVGITTVGALRGIFDHVELDTSETALSVSGLSETTVRNSRLISVTDQVVAGSNSTLTIEHSTLRTDSATEPVIQIFVGGDTIVRHSRLVTAGGSYADGTVGTLTLTQTFVDAATLSYSGTAACTATAEPGAFHGTTCP